MKKNLLTLLVCVAMASASRAQDPNFSQFFASPLTLNPALTGKFDGSFRVAGNYRNQWPTINNAFVTKTVSVDFGIMKNRLADIDQLGVGILGVTDRAGDGVLVTNYAGGSVAFHKGLDEDGFHQIGAGFQGTYVNKRLDVTKIDFQDELTPLGFTGVTSEIFLNNQLNISYFDLNAGVLYNGSTNGYNNFYIGASMYHINRPKESFQGGEYLLNTRTTIQAGGKIPVGSYNYLHIAANHSMQAKANNTVVGGAFSYNVNNNEDDPVNVYLGAWYRFNDAAIPYIGLEFKGIQIGASYDANTSSLKPASNTRGGMELSLIYIKKPTDPNAKKLNCPRF
ncbi:MAG: PorP/SprF family type IX secretion system membrane protein [Chitinophagaceae bacterium]|nr:PorP/SprF family type IX secretion system membrane protein [Chitinophagaceae bacterium]MBL0305828.1 PorP/SprF family type IX secretion system membrane protein [Chitinophagaceae bacterium]MBP6215099.1 PorP/SprF family type IX secretion system membrane protein [Chitinophagaceae bacterium]HQV60681.1 PorP/SprF family type IX secretion system membrane protein [Chitinophagaceae bacterium]HQV86265.1 PorP/SprF family type IX secretion system membrane protein [Chitinophagaceae bacterium]